MEDARRPVTFAGARLDRSRHVCAFFDTVDSRYGVLAPFVREGLERGEKIVHIVNPRLRDEHAARLRARGVHEEWRPGQHETLTWDEAYLRDGYFDQFRMIDQLTSVLHEGERAFPLIRLAAHMEWALEDRPGVDQLVEYETRLNFTLLTSKHPVI
jgi:MEDS: MEthanogen/methylotroph, DcmR Sensory domain